MKLDLEALKALREKAVAGEGEWAHGIAGNDDLVAYNGEDITGIAMVHNVARIKYIAALHNAFPALVERLERAEAALLGQFAAVKVGDFVNCRVTLGPGKGIVRELVPLHRMVKLESGWCLHQKDELIEHIPSAALSQEADRG